MDKKYRDFQPGQIINPELGIHVPKDASRHYSSVEDGLVPRSNCCDGTRLTLNCNHDKQWVSLVDPEAPNVFTGQEDEVGRFSIAYKRATGDFTIIEKVWKNPLNYIAFIQYNGTNLFDIIRYSRARQINASEEYGYALDDCLVGKEAGDVVRQGEYVYKSGEYTPLGYGWGRNLRTAYYPYKNMTYEDGYVLSETAAKKLESWKSETKTISINSNDIMLNLYGEDGLYKSFPSVGEHTKGNILCALRREDANSVLYSFSGERLKTISKTDQTFFLEGDVTDIDIYYNGDIKHLEKRNNEFSREIVRELKNQNDYYFRLQRALEKIIPSLHPKNLHQYLSPKEIAEYNRETELYGDFRRPIPKSHNPNDYTDELAYLWKTVHEYNNRNVYWRVDGKKFEGLKITFTILKKNPLVPGSKITGRFGNKGVISEIIPDDEMPKTDDGVPVEVFTNSLGVIARLNPAQWYETTINMLSYNILRRMKEADTYFDTETIYFDYLKHINKRQYDYIYDEYIMMSRADREAYLDTVIERGIKVHQSSFYDNISLAELAQMRLNDPLMFKDQLIDGVETPMVVGDMYMMRLKHEPGNKTAAVAAAALNQKGLPTKTDMKKERKTVIPKSPLRAGKMENQYFQLMKNPEAIAKFLRAHSTNEADRIALEEQLLTAADPFNIFVEICEERSISRTHLDKFLQALEIELITDEE